MRRRWAFSIVRRSAGLPAVLLLAVIFSTPRDAEAQPAWARPAPSLATSEWKACREQEAEGDARPCWRRWTKKYEKVATEAEVAYAQEKLKGFGGSGGQATAAASSKPVNSVVTPAEPAPTPTPYDDPTPQPEAAKVAAVEAVPTPAKNPVAGDVLDFCALAPRKDSARFVKQRLVSFAPANAALLDNDPTVKANDGVRLLREVFQAKFALERFHNVISNRSAKPEWAKAQSIPLAEVISMLDGNRVAAERSGNREAALEAAFVSYSLGCSDWVVIPTLDASVANWEEREVKDKKGNKRKIWEFSLALDMSVGVFRREGDHLKLLKTLAAHVPTLLDQATDMTAGAIPDVSLELNGKALIETAAKVIPVPKYISAMPDAACTVKAAGIDGAPTLGSCAKQGKLTAVFAAASVDERASDVCKDADAETPSAAPRKTERAICEVRVRSAQLARTLQKEARSLDGWRLFAPLQVGTPEDRNEPAMSLGKDEGVKVGWGFRSLDVGGNAVGYLKATHIGPGGQAGIATPSSLNLRMGDAPAGGRVEEYAQLGIAIQGSGGMMLLSGNDTTTVQGPSGVATFSLPGAAVGGGFSVGYDLASLLALSETWVRVGFGLYSGIGGSGAAARVIPIDVSFEKGFYLGSYLTFHVAGGPAMTAVNVDVIDTAAGTKGQHLSSSVYGVVARTGFDVMVSPDAAIRLEAVGRMNFGRAQYKDRDDDTLPVNNGWADRTDRYQQLGGQAALNWIF